MSLADLGGFWKRRRRSWQGLRPPAATPIELWKDLEWHHALYEEDGLSRKDRLAFLGLRIVQRVAYNIGWYLGGRS